MGQLNFPASRGDEDGQGLSADSFYDFGAANGSILDGLRRRSDGRTWTFGAWTFPLPHIVEHRYDVGRSHQVSTLSVAPEDMKRRNVVSRTL